MNVLQPTEELPGTLSRSDRETRSRGGLVSLLVRRPELRGVHAPADVASEATQWGV